MWVGRPLSWGKLESIQAWQATAVAPRASFWAVEADLQLAEGRLSFAGKDASPDTLDTRTRDRLQLARTGFERVLTSVGANSGQRTRASVGGQHTSALLRMPGAGRSDSFAGTLVTRAQWGASSAHPSNMNNGGSSWRRITVHHSAMSNPLPLSGSLADSSGAVRRIQKAHMQSSGYGDIGYHLLIDPSGRVFQGRELRWQGAHAGGSNNVANIGICLIGNFDDHRPTSAALASLGQVVGSLRAEHRISASNVVAHSDLKSTRCPGANLKRWVDGYSRAVAQR
ncbi:MAG: hypothetical protein ACI8QZ_003362 [Chlamydiales bacterium]|jgi:hypothetical protein